VTGTDLEQSIAEIARLAVGQVGVCAETIDGDHHIELNADEVYPTASSIKMYVLCALLAKVEEGQFALSERLDYASARLRAPTNTLRIWQRL